MQYLIVCINYSTRWLVSAVPITASEHVESFLVQSLLSKRDATLFDGNAEPPALTRVVCQICRVMESEAHHGVCRTPRNQRLSQTSKSNVNFKFGGVYQPTPRWTYIWKMPCSPSTLRPKKRQAFSRLNCCMAERQCYGMRARFRGLLSRSKKVQGVYVKLNGGYDRNRRPDPAFKPSELVMVARKPRAVGKTKKFLTKFRGGYLVDKQVAPTCHRMEDLISNQNRRIWRRFKVHSSKMRRYRSRAEVDWLPEDYETEASQWWLASEKKTSARKTDQLLTSATRTWGRRLKSKKHRRRLKRRRSLESICRRSLAEDGPSDHRPLIKILLTFNLFFMPYSGCIICCQCLDAQVRDLESMYVILYCFGRVGSVEAGASM